MSLVRVAVAYVLEADAENRKKGLNSRAVFTGDSGKSYDARGTIVLVRQGKEECVTRKLTIQVAALQRCFLDHLSLSVQPNVV